MKEFIWVVVAVYAFIFALVVSALVFFLLGSGLFDAEWLHLLAGVLSVPLAVLAWRLWAFCLDRT